MPHFVQDPAGAAALDIEHVDGGDDAPRIEMDLACGVLDLQVWSDVSPQARYPRGMQVWNIMRSHPLEPILLL